MSKSKNIERMRYQANKTSYSLALIAFLLNQYYLIVVMNNLTISFHIGIEILINLIVYMLLFLGMEKVRYYSVSWSKFFMWLGLFFVVRIAYMPLFLFKEAKELLAIADEFSIVTAQAKYTAAYTSAITIFVVGLLVLISGFIGYKKAVSLKSYDEKMGG